MHGNVIPSEKVRKSLNALCFSFLSCPAPEKDQWLHLHHTLPQRPYDADKLHHPPCSDLALSSESLNDEAFNDCARTRSKQGPAPDPAEVSGSPFSRCGLEANTRASLLAATEVRLSRLL